LFLILADCEWDVWKVGECSKDCGGGKRTNTRLVKIEAANGGKNCSGVPEISEDCNLEECPGIKHVE